MLVLSRKAGESIVIDGHIKVTFLGNKARIGIETESWVRVDREEVSARRRLDDQQILSHAQVGG